jgi:hypothetical protein
MKRLHEAPDDGERPTRKMLPRERKLARALAMLECASTDT